MIQRLVLMVVGCLAWSPAVASTEAASTPGEWHLLKGDLDGSQACVIAGLADSKTYLGASIDRGAQGRGVVQVWVVNPNWSLKPGDSTGEISLRTPYDAMTGTPPAISHGFAFYVSTASFLAWAKNASRGLWLERNGEITARFTTGNLEAKAQELLDCGTTLVDPDPFKK